MKFSEINNALSAGTTNAERVKVLASETQSTTIGIDDLATECDAAYWERNYGLFDAVVALYDVLSGRNTDSPISILGNLGVSNTTVDINGILNVDGTSVFMSNVDINANLFVTGSISTEENDISGGSFTVTASSAENGIIFVENERSANLGDHNRTIYFENGDLRINIPYTLEENDVYGMGGAIEFMRNGSTVFSVNDLGKMQLGGRNSIYSDSPGITIFKSDANNSSSVASIESHEDASGNKDYSSLKISEIKKHGSRPTKTVELELYANDQFYPISVPTSLFRFKFDNVIVASITESGFFSASGGSFSGALSCGSISSSGAASFASVGSVDATFTNIYCGVTELTGTGVGNGSAKFGRWVTVCDVVNNNYYAKLIAQTDYLLDIVNSSGNRLKFGYPSGGMSSTPHILTNGTEVLLQSGMTPGTSSNEIWLKILGHANGHGGIVFSPYGAPDPYAMFVNTNGEIRVSLYGGYPSGLNGDTEGWISLPRYYAAAIDCNSVSALNAAMSTVCEGNANAVGICMDINNGPSLVYNNGTDWKLSGPVDRGLKILSGNSNYAIESGYKVIAVTAQPTLSRVVLPTALNKAGTTIRIFDHAGTFATNNLTVQTEGASEKINNSTSDYVMNVNGQSITLISDGSHWWLI